LSVDQEHAVVVDSDFGSAGSECAERDEHHRDNSPKVHILIPWSYNHTKVGIMKKPTLVGKIKGLLIVLLLQVNEIKNKAYEKII